MAEELKPCPFCGNDAKVTTFKDEALSSHNIIDWYEVRCTGCEVRIERFEDKDEAIENWNTRPLEDQLQQARADLAEARDQVANFAAREAILERDLAGARRLALEEAAIIIEDGSFGSGFEQIGNIHAQCIRNAIAPPTEAARKGKV